MSKSESVLARRLNRIQCPTRKADGLVQQRGSVMIIHCNLGYLGMKHPHFGLQKPRMQMEVDTELLLEKAGSAQPNHFCLDVSQNCRESFVVELLRIQHCEHKVGEWIPELNVLLRGIGWHIVAYCSTLGQDSRSSRFGCFDLVTLIDPCLLLFHALPIFIPPALFTTASHSKASTGFTPTITCLWLTD